MSKLFGGMNLKDIAGQVKERGEASPLARSSAQPTLAAAELAITGRTAPALERENILAVDPKRCRPWKYHNRTVTWYSPERCKDLIESFGKDGQAEPALARKLVGDPNYDFELIYGMRRRYAAEYTKTKLKVRVTDVDDAKGAVLMHIENADRKDISAMERAISFQGQLEAKLFGSQDAMCEAFRVSKGQMAKLLKAAQLLKHVSIAQLFPDKSAVPVDLAYKLATALERPAAKDVVLKAAQNQAAKGGGTRSPAAVIKMLLESIDRSKYTEPLKREYHIGPSSVMTVARTPKGKVTIAFPTGVREADRAGLLPAIEQMLKDLG